MMRHNDLAGQVFRQMQVIANTLSDVMYSLWETSSADT